MKFGEQTPSAPKKTENQNDHGHGGGDDHGHGGGHEKKGGNKPPVEKEVSKFRKDAEEERKKIDPFKGKTDIPLDERKNVINGLAGKARRYALDSGRYEYLMKKKQALESLDFSTEASKKELNSINNEIKLATVAVTNLSDYKHALGAVGMSQKEVIENLAHENAHANEAEALASRGTNGNKGENVAFSHYSVVVQKDKNGNYSYLPQAHHYYDILDKKRARYVNRRIAGAPDEHGKYSNLTGVPIKTSPSDKKAVAEFDALDKKEGKYHDPFDDSHDDEHNHHDGHDDPHHNDPHSGGNTPPAGGGHNTPPGNTPPGNTPPGNHTPPPAGGGNTPPGGGGNTPPPGKKVANANEYSAVAGVVDATDLAEKRARDLADHHMTESKEDRSQNFLTKWATRMWKHNIFESFYRQKEYLRNKNEIFGSKNLYGNISAHNSAMDSIISRFTSEHRADMLRDGESSTPPTSVPEINALVKRYMQGSVNDSDFEQEKTAIITRLEAQYTSRDRLFADNLLQIAKGFKQKYEHSDKITDADVDVKLVLGKAKESLNTEAKLNTFDRCWDKFKKTKVGQIIGNEAAVSLVGAGAYSLGKFFGIKALRSKLGQAFTFGGTAAALAGVTYHNESTRLKKERAQHMRERAKGMEFNENDMVRRDEMKRNDYEARGSKEIISNLELGLEKFKQKKSFTPSEMQSLQDLIVDVDARVLNLEVKERLI